MIHYRFYPSCLCGSKDWGNVDGTYFEFDVSEFNTCSISVQITRCKQCYVHGVYIEHDVGGNLFLQSHHVSTEPDNDMLYEYIEEDLVPLWQVYAERIIVARNTIEVQFVERFKREMNLPRGSSLIHAPGNVYEVFWKRQSDFFASSTYIVPLPGSAVPIPSSLPEMYSGFVNFSPIGKPFWRKVKIKTP